MIAIPNVCRRIHGSSFMCALGSLSVRGFSGHVAFAQFQQLRLNECRGKLRHELMAIRPALQHPPVTTVKVW